MERFRVLSVFTALLATGALLTVGCGGGNDASSSGDSEWSGNTIKIGSIFSTSNDGAAFGPQQVNGAKLAIKEINAEGGVKGATLDLIQRNDEADPVESAAAMKELVKDGMLAVLGPTFSNSAAEADPVANTAKTPVLAVSNTGPGIVSDCPYPCEYIFRNSLGEADAIPASIGEYAKVAKPKTAAILHPAEDPFGASSAETAKQAFQKNKVKVALDTVYPGDLKAVLEKDPNAVMVAASSGEVVAQIISDLRERGFAGQILGGNAFNSLSTAASLGGTGAGSQSAAAWYSGNESDVNQSFISDYKDEYGMEPDQFAAQAYTGVELLASAAETSDLVFTSNGLSGDRKEIKKALEAVQEETPLGDFRFTKDHDVVQPIWIVQMDGQGGFKLVKELPPK